MRGRKTNEFSANIRFSNCQLLWKKPRHDSSYTLLTFKTASIQNNHQISLKILTTSINSIKFHPKLWFIMMEWSAFTKNAWMRVAMWLSFNHCSAVRLYAFINLCFYYLRYEIKLLLNHKVQNSISTKNNSGEGDGTYASRSATTSTFQCVCYYASHIFRWSCMKQSECVLFQLWPTRSRRAVTKSP